MAALARMARVATHPADDPACERQGTGQGISRFTDNGATRRSGGPADQLRDRLREKPKPQTAARGAADPSAISSAIRFPCAAPQHTRLSYSRPASPASPHL